MTREEARTYFNDRLTYKDIHVEELEDLHAMLKKKVSEFSSGEYSPYIERIRKNDKRFVRRRLMFACLYISSYCDSRRKLIQFQPNGYIAFLCSDYEHADALLPVFTEWVDYVYKHK